ncbi:hypothetical protein RIF29_24725 [Crotalaria pallida]|uniref:Uncharacterized protein n=1 Tax=Crotalaria pallida TaxID=3830 RepID=A0AAN9EK85_CROPI
MAMSTMRTKRSLVKPKDKTPSTSLDLSAIDRLPVLRCNARTLHVFKHGPEATSVIREALSKALVPYYPLAGRLRESKPGFLQIECSGDGAWFVEASADCTLESVNFFDDVETIPYDDLLPDDVPEVEGIDPLVKMQVTQFGCGGFVIGLVFCHSICDGLGAAQFLNAIGELARGLDKPSIEPVWHRHFFPSPQTPQEAELPKLPPPIIMPDYQLQHANIDIHLDQINKLKQQFQQATGQNCSSFEIVAAGFWRSRTRAINFDPNTQVKLVFFANCRHLLHPPLPNGFYGNCFFPVSITSSCESLKEASIFDVVKLIQATKAKLPMEFGKYLKGEHLKSGEDPFAPPLTYTTLFISEWGKLGFNHVDYQWGPPVHVVPIQGSSIIPVGIVGSMPLPNKGIRLMTWCVEQAHCGPFLDHMHGVMAH